MTSRKLHGDVLARAWKRMPIAEIGIVAIETLDRAEFQTEVTVTYRLTASQSALLIGRILDEATGS